MRYDTIRKIICKRFLTDQYPLRECRAASSQKKYPSETYIDKTKVLGIKQVSFEFRSEDCGRQIFVFQGWWEHVPCSRSRDRKPTRAESLGECSRYDEITTSCRTMRSQRTTVWYRWGVNFIAIWGLDIPRVLCRTTILCNSVSWATSI